MGKEKVEKGLIQAITPDSWTKHYVPLYTMGTIWMKQLHSQLV